MANMQCAYDVALRLDPAHAVAHAHVPTPPGICTHNLARNRFGPFSLRMRTCQMVRSEARRKMTLSRNAA